MKTTGWIFVGIGAGLLLPSSTIAQTTTGVVPKPTATIFLGPVRFTLDGWTRVETRYQATLNDQHDDNPQNEFSRTRLSFDYTTGTVGKDSDTIFVQPQLEYRHTLHAASLTSNGVTQRLDWHQVYWQTDVGRNKVLRLGRQELAFGEQRLVGAGNWTYQGRSFDGLRLTNRQGAWTMDAFATKLGHVASKTINPTLAGVYATRTQGKTASTDVYLLYKNDRVGGNGIAVWTFGARPVRQLTRQVSTSAEMAVQTGRTNGKDLRAWAGIGQLHYQFPGNVAPRFSLEYDYASGGDPNNPETIGTFDNLFPTNHFFYGIGDFVGLRNMQDVRLMVRGRIARQGTLTLENHHFFLANSRDFWYGDNAVAMRGANGKAVRDPSGQAGNNLGQEMSVMASYPVKPNVTLLVGAARFTPGSYVRRVAGCDCASNWFFTQTGYRW